MEEMSFNFQLQTPQPRDYITQNILSLEERIQVIKEFDRKPVYLRIAKQFNCSAKQIKNIIANRESLLLCHANSQTNVKTQDARRERHHKILFLGKVIYEYILRSVYHNFEINVNTIRQKAMQIKESLAIANFSPNGTWLQNFKVCYQIPEYDLNTLLRTINFNEPKSDSLDTIDIIQYVTKQERLERIQKHINESNGNSRNKGPKMILSENNDMSNINKSTLNDAESPIVCLDSDDDTNANDYDDDDCNAKKQRLQVTSTEDYVALPDIRSYHEALMHVKALQDFAMLQDNYRAIGLITQLEEVFKKPPNFNDFDDSL